MLKALADARHLDARWSLSSGGDTRLLAAALGYRYQKTASGAFTHTVAVVALDPAGRPIARMDRLGDHAAFTKAVAAATARPNRSSVGSGATR